LHFCPECFLTPWIHAIRYGGRYVGRAKTIPLFKGIFKIMANAFHRSLFIPQLGPRNISSPGLGRDWGAAEKSWISDADRVLLDDRVRTQTDTPTPEEMISVELAGPRRRIYFQPESVTCAIVTCGGLCPGINDVIRSLVMHTHYCYGVRRILGLRFGYESLNLRYGHKPVELTPEKVGRIQYFGGSVLGISRGQQEAQTMVDQLEALGVHALFVVGGDGSQRGARDIYEEATKRGLKLSVVGIPKTIDNDLLYMDRSFGYLTAFSEAFRTLGVAHAEARGARNGIGLVKLMGRDSGFIACSAALATAEANFVLIPEVPFKLEGVNGLLSCLERRLNERGHALIVVAEGAGQELCAPAPRSADASGNRRYSDIGALLRERIQTHFHSLGQDFTLKYIDPGYQLRGVVATPEDRIFCLQLARHAVHAALSGKTGMVVALWHQHYVHLPVHLVATGRRRVDPEGDLWRCVLENTGQPARMG
jgi:6-phosphofructokinase 1